MLDDYPSLHRKLEALKRRTAEAAGELNAVLKTLKQYGYDSVEEAEKDLPNREKKDRDLAARYAKEKAKLEDEYREHLEGL